MGDRLGTLGAVGFRTYFATFPISFLCSTRVDVNNLGKRLIWKGLVRFPDANVFVTLTSTEPRVYLLSTRSRDVIASSKEA